MLLFTASMPPKAMACMPKMDSALIQVTRRSSSSMVMSCTHV
jgi:hypothetical protein